MKKSQILAALALAFALGLGAVAPVANTYAVEYTDVVVRTTGEATGAEVEARLTMFKATRPTTKLLLLLRRLPTIQLPPMILQLLQPSLISRQKLPL